MNAEQRREQIITEALQLFAAHGLEGVRTRQIAQACGVSEGVLFHFFKSKQDLQQACFEHELNREFQAGKALDSDLETTLVKYAMLFLDEIRDRPAAFRFILQNMLSQPEQSILFYRNRGSKEYSGFIRGLLEEAQASGELRRMDPEFAADVFVGILFFLSMILEFFNRPAALDRTGIEARARAVVDLFLNGLRKDGSAGKEAGR